MGSRGAESRGPAEATEVVASSRAAGCVAVTRFAGGGLHGLVATALASADPLAEARRLVDPAAATETIHWGRNYLYAADFAAASGRLEVIVKQFRNLGWRRRLGRRLRGSKAERAWRVAAAVREAGLTTPEPVMLIESDDPEGPSFFVTRRVSDAFEVRHFFRRLNREPEPGLFPEVDVEAMLETLGRLARRLHDAGIVYRDLSIGNVLARVEDGAVIALDLVDGDRASLDRRPGLFRRCRDACRLPILERAHQDAFLNGYWGELPGTGSPRRWLWTSSVRAFLLRNRVKEVLRAPFSKPPSGGRHHAHIPPPAEGASVRDRAVWDELSDQPHQHANRAEKLLIRLSDAPRHLRDLTIVAGAGPRIWRRYRRLTAGLYRAPVELGALGVGLRPIEGAIEAQVEAVAELGLGHVLLRLHPWDDDHTAEERLAAALAERGAELVFALPQNRDLVRDPARWRAVVAELGERFAPYGRRFQVGQAPNRSKWGVWTRDEYVRLYRLASEALRCIPGAELAGPAVIDFELHHLAALVNRRAPGLAFDAVSSLLYVDRRGAPESRQLGFDTVGKVVLLRAIAETGRASSGRCWITEVNWPLWEGPHAPAGRMVAVDEQSQADYLARYFVLVLTTGLVERVYWWRLVARGYGLITPNGTAGWRRRPSFAALRTLVGELEGATSLGPLSTPDGVRLYSFRRGGDGLVVGWSLGGARSAALPSRPARVLDRDGSELPRPDGVTVELTSSPCYFELAPAPD